jgi:hypothetical protein
MFHPYSSVARITVTVTPTPATFSLSSVHIQLSCRPLQEAKGGSNTMAVNISQSSNPALRTMTVLTYNLARTEMIPNGQNISCMMSSPGPCLSGS